MTDASTAEVRTSEEEVILEVGGSFHLDENIVNGLSLPCSDI
jgi:hypothetical protein